MIDTLQTIEIYYLVVRNIQNELMNYTCWLKVMIVCKHLPATTFEMAHTADLEVIEASDPPQEQAAEGH